VSGPVKNGAARPGAVLVVAGGVIALVLCAAAGFGLTLVSPSVALWVVLAVVGVVAAVGAAIRRDLTR
jgi:hypothetical protein